MAYNITPTFLQVKNLSVFFNTGKYFFLQKKRYALSDISFTLSQGETLAICGDAGSGKSTLLQILNDSSAASYEGEILLYEKNIRDYDRRDRVSIIRMMYPDPDTALNPHIRVYKILETPLSKNTSLSPREIRKRISVTTEYVGLREEHLSCYLHMLTDIQKLRLSLARALVLRPQALLVDSSVEKLDAMLRMDFYNMFLDLQKRYRMTLIICLNDLCAIKHLADKVLILDRGKSEEIGSVAKVLVTPVSDLARRIQQSYNHEYRSIHS
ncbi:ATP-binding cassette domain-containing protein [Succinimonas amylolytica]|uniref:ATP-binding cassette domain-containing protein n=1 Tax=Succinimonas amylolytica TaxID=83769 RepID=UPI0003718352|nr:ATP-binding cassette domain-containing protein [Succinimonas amylolytica]